MALARLIDPKNATSQLEECHFSKVASFVLSSSIYWLPSSRMPVLEVASFEGCHFAQSWHASPWARVLPGRVALAGGAEPLRFSLRKESYNR